MGTDTSKADARTGQAAGDSLALFLARCRSESLARDFVLDQAGELKAALRTLQERWHRVRESIRSPEFTVPARAYPDVVREADFGALTGLDLSNWAVVSLDVFDTCLVRLVSDPALVFYWAGLRLREATGMDPEAFVIQRQATEAALREAALRGTEREDVLLADIYAGVGEAAGWSSETVKRAIDTELECERALLVPVETVRHLALERVASDQPLVYTSEMYLSAEQLTTCLREAGFPVEGTRVLTSGETGKSKGTGNLYRLLGEASASGKLLHIGDNPSTDRDVPQRLGIESALIQAPRTAHASLLPAVMESVVREDAFAAGGYWERLGYRLAGPLHLAYAVWLYRRCQNEGLRAVYFLARDGWFTKQVFDRLQRCWGAVAETHYLYASRELLGLGSMKTIEAADWEFLLKPAPLLRTRDFFERLQIPFECYGPLLEENGLPGPDERICHHWGFVQERYKESLYRVICSCIDTFLAYREPLGKDLCRYYEEAGVFAPEALFVDLGWAGSSGRAIRRMAGEGRCPRGAYFALFETPDSMDKAYFCGPGQSEEATALLKSGINLLELFFGSPEPTVCGIAATAEGWQPQFRRPWAAANRAAWAGLGSGLHHYAERVLERLPTDPGGEAHALLERLLTSFIHGPTRQDLQAISIIEHGEGWGTDHRLRMLPRTVQPGDPSLQAEAFCYAPWKGGLAAAIRLQGEDLTSSR